MAVISKRYRTPYISLNASQVHFMGTTAVNMELHLSYVGLAQGSALLKETLPGPSSP